ncbi:MAG: hypothetical protein ACP5NS_00115 [Candidatus Pacearchaeota archaeon]
MSQEFYALPYNEATIRGFVFQSGFREEKGPPRGYSAKGAFLQVQRITNGAIEKHIARDSGLEVGFLLDLEKSQEEYDRTHPVTKLLEKCSEAKVFKVG